MQVRAAREDGERDGVLLEARFAGDAKARRLGRCYDALGR